MWVFLWSARTLGVVRGLSSRSPLAWLHWGLWDLSSPTRDRICIPCIAKQILREVPGHVNSLQNQVCPFCTVPEREAKSSLIIVSHCSRDASGPRLRVSPWSLFSLYVKSLNDKILLFYKGQKLISYRLSISDLLKDLLLCREIANDIIEKVLIAYKIQY